MVKGAVYGNTIVALFEGFIGGVAFWVVDLPSPVLWGAVMAITAYIPMIGAGLVWVPAAIYFGLQGAYLQLAVLVAAGLGIAMIDYLVRHIVVGQASKLHALIMFFSVIGGLQFFGLIGIIAGLFVVAVAVAFLETSRSERTVLGAGAVDRRHWEESIARRHGAG